MPNRTDVYIREVKVSKTVLITGEDKPEIDKMTIAKWQNIIKLIARIMDVPSGLIMKITDDSMEVFLKSNSNKNPYEVGEKACLGEGLYCETVIGNDDELLVENALRSKAWQDNPDVKLDMISYYGLPLKWPDGSFFGTICVLDNQSNKFSEIYKELIREFKFAIESDLQMLMDQKQMKYYAEVDRLTDVFNRHKAMSILSDEFNRSSRTGIPFSIALLDIDSFKAINDTYGHDVGDDILKAFSKSFKEHIRSIDSFCRWGGDEFLLICPNTDKLGIRILTSKIKDIVLDNIGKIVKDVSYSCGVSIYKISDESYEQIIKRADLNLYKEKDKK